MVWFYLDAQTLKWYWRAHLSIPLWSDFIPLTQYYIYNPNLSFNPTMVWFYLTEKPDIKFSKNLFQSHYGLILSMNSLYGSFYEKITFNPTMVWFYRNARIPDSSMIKRTFNPTMVWFYRTQVRSGLLEMYRTFNPTMVWFYHSMKR